MSFQSLLADSQWAQHPEDKNKAKNRVFVATLTQHKTFCRSTSGWPNTKATKCGARRYEILLFAEQQRQE